MWCFFFRRDTLLLHYPAFLFATGLFTLITSGLLHVWLGTDAEQYILRSLAEPIEIIFYALYFNFILQSIEVTKSPDSFLFRSWILIISVLFSYAIGFFIFRTIGVLKSYTPGFVAIRIFIFFLTSIMLYQCFRLRHVTFQSFILLGSGCYFLFGLTAFIAKFKATPTMWIRPPDWLVLGSFIDIIFFSIALSYRYRMIWQHMNREKLEAANELIRVKDELLKKQSALQNERRRIATDMHDDLGSGLTQITYLSQGLKRNEQQEIIIGKISETASGLVQNLSEIIWAMKEVNNSLCDLISYIRSYASDYLETNNME